MFERLKRRLQFLRRQAQWDSELQEEMRFHREMRRQKNSGSGMPDGEARFAARRSFGNDLLLREQARESWGWSGLESVWRDIVYTVRGLRQNPGFTTAAVLTLALGIGANTAIFSVVDAVLLRSLPVANPSELYHAEFITAQGDRNNFSWPLFHDFRDRNDVFTAMYASPGTDPRDMRGSPGPVRAGVQLVSGEYFQTLGVRPLRGRLLTPDDIRPPGSAPFAVVSYGFWNRYFGGDAEALGQTLTIGRIAFTIIGVAPPEFFGDYVGEAVDVWLPVTMQREIIRGQDLLTSRNVSWLNAVGRLRPGISPAEAEKRLTALAAAIHNEHSTKPADAPRVVLKPAVTGLSNLRERFSAPLRVLMGLVSLLLLLACANVANLLLARGAARTRETAIRLSIGCGAFRLVRQCMTEAFLLAILGAGLGLLIARWGADLLVVMASRPEDPYRLDVAPDLRVLLFCCGVSILCALLFGLAPALRATAVDIQRSLKGSELRSRMQLGRLIVGVQVGISMILLFAASLFVRTLTELRTFDAGMAREGVAQVRFSTQASGIGNDQLRALYDRVVRQSLQTPGVRSAALAFKGLIGSGRSRTCCLAAEGRPILPESQRRVNTNDVTTGYFETVGMQLLAGRDFRPWEEAGDLAPVIVNETLAHRFFGETNVVGRRVGWGDSAEIKFLFEIVGVVKDAKYVDLREDSGPMLFFPAKDDNHLRALVIRTDGNAAYTGAEVRRGINRTDPQLEIEEVQTISQAIDRILLTERLLAKLTSLFGILALVLAGVGLFGVLSYRTARRTPEIGVRMALGARRSDIRRLVWKDAAPVVLAGLAAGAVIAVAASGWVESFLFGVSRQDPWSLLTSGILMAVTAAIAAWWPARRAARTDPQAALRVE